MANLHPTTTAFRRPRENAGAPGAGTSEVQTLTIGGTPTGGTFKLAYKGQITGAITWTTVDETLRDDIDAKLGALSTIGGAGNIATAIGTASDGIGTFTITFGANLAKLNVPLITVAVNSLTGTSPTVVIASTTAGVTATHRGAPKGTLLIDTDNGVWYQQTGTIYAPTWTAVDVASVSQEMIDLAAAIPTVAVANLGAATAVAVAGPTPAGGTGATAGAYDTAAHRDELIATVAELKVTANALVTDLASARTKLNDLLAKLRTAGIVTP